MARLTRPTSIWLCGVLAMLCMGTTDAVAAPTAPPEPATFHATILRISPGHLRIEADLAGLPGHRTLDLPNTGLQAMLSPARTGDQATVTVDDVDRPKAVIAVTALTRPVSPIHVLLALAGAAGLLFAICMWATGGRPIALVTGRDGRLSNSQCQLAIWFASVAIVYTATLVLRGIDIGTDFIGGVGMSTNLVVLTGLSAFTFGAAKLVTTQQVYDRAVQEKTPPPVPPPAPLPPPSSGPKLSDLARNGYEDTDLGDLQMILVTVAAAAIFLCQSFWFLRDLPLSVRTMLPDVDGTLLASFGLGQGAYLFKKAATPLNKG
jgi:hypothetical protein